MTVRVAINGFGRIGRNYFRAVKEQGADIEIVAVNDLGSIETMAHLLRHDSVAGPYPGAVKATKSSITVDGQRLSVLSERDPADLPWEELRVDVVIESTGFFTRKDAASAHLAAGAKKVIISAPSGDADGTFVVGVNDDTYNPARQHIISNASCTTNCLALMVSVLEEAFGLEQGLMTTIHAYTGDQPTLDTSHKDLRRACAAAMSMIPTSTGAARSVGEVLPHLRGKMNGSAIRVPTANVSVVDFGFTSNRDTSTQEVNALLKTAAKGPMKGILGINERPLVSIDFNHDPHSSIADLTQTHVMNGRLVRVLAWYDNEWGFSCRMLDNAAEIGKTL